MIKITELDKVYTDSYRDSIPIVKKMTSKELSKRMKSIKAEEKPLIEKLEKLRGESECIRQRIKITPTMAKKVMVYSHKTYNCPICEYKKIRKGKHRYNDYITLRNHLLLWHTLDEAENFFFRKENEADNERWI